MQIANGHLASFVDVSTFLLEERMPSPIASSQRIESHNQWPKKVNFGAEVEFQKRLAEYGGLAPFKTAHLKDTGTEEFHRYLGSLIDGLDALPQRPDYLFDHCFRVIDAGSKLLTGKTKTTYAINEAYLPLFSPDPQTWKSIVRKMCDLMPKSAANYMAKRIIDSAQGNGTDSNAIVARAKKCLGNQRVSEMTQKFSNPTSPGRAVNDCGAFLRLLLKTNSPLPKKAAASATYPSLDLSLASNLLSEQDRLRIIMSLFLFTMRNERQHGSSVSPFRSSLAKQSRYASFYYAMICAYTVCLGVISVRSPGSISASEIEKNLDNNTAELICFFGANLK